MRPVSARWDPAASHTSATLVQLLPRDGGDPVALPVEDGKVVLDSRAEVRGRVEGLTIPGAQWVPSDPADPLAPFGNEIRVWRGMQYGPGDVGEITGSGSLVFVDSEGNLNELVSLGIFGIEEAESSEGVTMLNCLDRSQRLIDASFTEDYTIAGGTDFLTGLRNTLIAGYPQIVFDFIERELLTPTLIASEGDNRWSEFCLYMAEAIGCELYFNGDGIAKLAPIPDPASTAPVARIEEGEGGMLLSASKKMSREGAYNRFTYIGENPDNEVPPRGVATDEDPASPTYWGGPFGQKPAPPEHSAFISTDAQAADAAAGRLARERGVLTTVDFGAIPNPALEPSDVVGVRRSISGIDEAHAIDMLEYPLNGEEMTGATRGLRVV